MNGKVWLSCPVCRETLKIKIGIENEPEDKSDAVGGYICLFIYNGFKQHEYKLFLF